MSEAMCTTCGEPLTYVPSVGLVGVGGVCRHPLNPNDDDEGQHLMPRPLIYKHDPRARARSTSFASPRARVGQEVRVIPLRDEAGVARHWLALPMPLRWEGDQA